MKLQYKKIGTVKKPDGSNFNICGFNQMPFAEYILKGTCDDYTRTKWMKIQGSDDIIYYVPLGARTWSLVDKEYKNRRPGETRLRIKWEDDYLDCLDYSTDWNDALENNTLTFILQMLTSQTKQDIGYGKYRYTNTYVFKITASITGSLSWEDWVNTFWPSGSVSLSLDFKNKTVTSSLTKTNMNTTFSNSSWTETNTTGSTLSSNLADIHIYPDVDIINSSDKKVQAYLSCGQYTNKSTYTTTLKNWSGNE